MRDIISFHFHLTVCSIAILVCSPAFRLLLPSNCSIFCIVYHGEDCSREDPYHWEYLIVFTSYLTLFRLFLLSSVVVVLLACTRKCGEAIRTPSLGPRCCSSNTTEGMTLSQRIFTARYVPRFYQQLAVILYSQSSIWVTMGVFSRLSLYHFMAMYGKCLLSGLLVHLAELRV